MKKILFPLSAMTVMAAPIAATVSCGSLGESFTGIGSNSVSPLIGNGKFANTHNPVGKYSYTNTGSGSGFGSQVASKVTADFGMTSSLKRPGIQDEDKYGSKQEQLDNWANNKIRTITWAIDAIAVGINLPTGITITGSATPQIDATLLAKVYNGDSVKWTDLLLNEDTSSSTDTVTPIFITGGKDTSGKSEAFVKGMHKAAAGGTTYSGIGSTPSKRPITLKDGFDKHEDLTGNHGHTDSFTDLLVDNNDTDGSIMYYSLGQIQKELEDTTSSSHSNIVLGAVKGFGSDAVAPTRELAQAGTYTYTRPFNMIYSVDNKKSLKFAEWLLSKTFQDEVAKVYVELDESKQEVKDQKSNLSTPDLKKDVNSQGLFAKPTVANAASLKLGLEI